jgi:large subunit ribosomal protein L13
MAKIIIDADGAIYGRLCSFAAKRTLEGDDVTIVNSDKVMITGSRKKVIERYGALLKKGQGGNPKKRPHHSRDSHRILKRGIRGMLPDHRRGIGKQAFLRIKCFEGVPIEMEGKKMIKAGKEKGDKYVELNELTNRL